MKHVTCADMVLGGWLVASPFVMGYAMSRPVAVIETSYRPWAECSTARAMLSILFSGDEDRALERDIGEACR